MSTKGGKSLGEIIKEDMKLKGINGSAVARKMNVSRQIINKIDSRKRFDIQFLIDFKKASGLDYTQYAYENVVKNLLNEDDTHYQSLPQDSVTLTLNVSCKKNRVSDFSKFLEQVESVAQQFGYKII